MAKDKDYESSTKKVKPTASLPLILTVRCTYSYTLITCVLQMQLVSGVSKAKA